MFDGPVSGFLSVQNAWQHGPKAMDRPARRLTVVVLVWVLSLMAIFAAYRSYAVRNLHTALFAESLAIGRSLAAAAGPGWRMPDTWPQSNSLASSLAPVESAAAPNGHVIAAAAVAADGRILYAAPFDFAPMPQSIRRWLALSAADKSVFELVSGPEVAPGLRGQLGILIIPARSEDASSDERIIVASIVPSAGLPLSDLPIGYIVAGIALFALFVAALAIAGRQIDGVISRQYHALVSSESELTAKSMALEREVRERQATERELSESEERFRSAFDTAAHGMTLNAPGGRFVRTNRRFLSILGDGPDDILSLGIRDVLHPDDRDSCWAQFNSLFEGKTRSFARDVRMLRETGEPHWVMLSVSIVRVRPGNSDYFISQVLDINEQKEAVAALRESEGRFRSLVEGSLQGMIIESANGIGFCNTAFAEMFGYEMPEQLLDLSNTASLYSAEDRHWVTDLQRRCLEGESVTDRLEVNALRRDGEAICIEMTMRPIIWRGVPAVQTAINDITARKVAERALRSSEQRLATAQRIAGLGNWELHCATGAVRWSAEASRIFGVVDHVSGGDYDSLLAFVHPEDRDAVKAAVERVTVGGGSFDIEHRVLRPDGSERYVQQQAEAVVGPLGTPVRVTGTLLDVTVRKQAENRAQDQYRFLQTLIDAIPVPIFYKDADGIYAGCNKSFESFIGKTRDQIIGRDVFQVSPRDLAQRYYVADKELMQTRGSQVYEASVHYADGTDRAVMFHKATFTDSHGRLAGLVGALLDISDLKRAQEALQKSEELHRMFAADAAHELRTPLAIMRAQVDALPDSEAVRSLRADVDGMSRLITQLLAATRLDFLAIGPDDRADISRIATNVATYLAPIAFGAGRSIEVIGADQAIMVRGNSDALEQAVRNLVENAIKYSARRTTITITVSDEPMIEVRDRGRGIPPELRKHVFERFQRADRRSSGAGLGLSIVQRAVEAHQGTVEVADAPDGGAVFRIHLPPLASTVAA
jgi:PAS domain S-box-containing protein